MIRASEVALATSPESAPDDAEILNILSVADLKAEHRRRDTAEDARWQDALVDAYVHLDGPGGYLNRAILRQSWKGFIEKFDDEIEVPLPPLVSVDSIRYRNTSGTWTVLSTDVYGVVTSSLVGYVFLKSGQSWPSTDGNPQPIEITFTAGMEDGAAVIAAGSFLRPVRKALKLLGGHFFFNPTPTFVEPRLVEVPRSIKYGLEYTLGRIRIVNDHA